MMSDRVCDVTASMAASAARMGTVVPAARNSSQPRWSASAFPEATTTRPGRSTAESGAAAASMPR